jgi:NAD+-dependent protein deacetylase sirtuin 5
MKVPTVDLMMAIGTSAVVLPAAAYIHAARAQGARIAVFNTEPPDEEAQENPMTRLREGVDWYFEGSGGQNTSRCIEGSDWRAQKH